MNDEPAFSGHDRTIDEILANQELTGKRILITGTSAGLGLETARAFVARGAEVVGAVANVDKARAAATSFATSGPGVIDHVALDLASLATIRRCAEDLLADGRHFDVLVLNAGIMACPQSTTEDGFELQFGVNHLGHFALTNRLRPLLSRGSRVICLSSNAHRTAELDFDDLLFTNTPYNEWLAYGRSKSANALFAKELDRRWQGEGIRAASVHPGGIMTELDRHLAAGAMAEMAAVMDRQLVAAGRPKLRWKSVPQGAATTAWAAVAPEREIGGKYCEDCAIAVVDDAEGQMSGVRSFVYDPALGASLWDASAEMTGLGK